MIYQADPEKVTDYKRKYIRRAQWIMFSIQAVLAFGIYQIYHPSGRYSQRNTPPDPVIQFLFTFVFLWMIYKMFVKLVKDSALYINQSIVSIEFNSSVIRFCTTDCSMFGGIFTRSVYCGEMRSGEFKASLFVSKSESRLVRGRSGDPDQLRRR